MNQVRLLKPVKGRWADTKKRCRLCRIVLVGGAPPSPCLRRGCQYAAVRAFVEPVSPVGSTLSGSDFSEIGR